VAAYPAEAALPGEETMSGAMCPCGSGRVLEACCGPFHAGTPAPDAESLMRSRYSAYVLGLEAYLEATWHPDTRPAALALDATPRPQWLGLAIRSHTLLDASHATVEFVARYKLNGRAFKLHEVSRFEKMDGRWLYVDGLIQE
jgi:SEC-C motif-containing protein